MKKLTTTALFATTILTFGCLPESETVEESTGGSSGTTETTETHGLTALITDQADAANGNDTGELRYTLDSGSTLASGTFSADLWLAEGETQTVKVTVFGASASNSNRIAEIRIDESYATQGDGYAGIRYDSGDTTSLIEIETDTWFNVSFEWELSSETFSFYVDGSLIDSDDFVVTGINENAQNFAIKIADNGGTSDLTSPLYVDNLEIYSDTSGTTEVFSDDFESFTAGDAIDDSNSDYSSSNFGVTASDTFVD